MKAVTVLVMADTNDIVASLNEADEIVVLVSPLISLVLHAVLIVVSTYMFRATVLLSALYPHQKLFYGPIEAHFCNTPCSLFVFSAISSADRSD